MTDDHQRLLASAQLIARACASLELGSSHLTQAATDLSSATALLNRSITPRPLQSVRKSSRTNGPNPKVQDAPRKPTISPYFPEPGTKPKKKPTAGPTISPFFPEPFSRERPPPGLKFELQAPEFGLIQERICDSVFALVIQAILWNKTKGTAARPILWKVLCTYPTPELLASADPTAVQELIRILGLQERRAQCLVKLAQVWVAAPPSADRRYGRRDYPKGEGRDVKNRELLGPDDEREGWEIGHLPGIGEYALDSYRIFGRDRLRGLQDAEGVEPEWKRVIPNDKELAPYVKFKWAQEGWDYDIVSGARQRLP
ncbi:methyl-CpG binding domain-containing protein 4 [Paraphaeosphaeria sporulosa]